MRPLITVAVLACASLVAVLQTGCSRREDSPVAPTPVTDSPESSASTEATPAALALTSSAFSEGERIPPKYTCDGEDVSPPLSWSGAPEGTKSLALICRDPDAPTGTWVHWVLYNIAPDTTELPEGVPTTTTLDGDVLQGPNDFEKIGYGGPCPPKGKPHRYCFTLYAVEVELDDLNPTGAIAEAVEHAMSGFVLAEGDLTGTYKRR